MRRLMYVFCAGLLVSAAGCPMQTPPAEAVLQGDWAFASDDLTGVLTFDSNGILTTIEATSGQGVMATLNVQNSTSTVDGAMVTVLIPTNSGNVTFEGTLSADENTMEGSLTQEIEFDNAVITIPQGDITLDREVTDPCEGVMCDEGETCVDGECVAEDPCEGVMCDEGETCVDGECVAGDPCEGVMCNEGETCVDGECVVEDACADVSCATCEMCVEGECVPLEGDAETGAEVYAANCAVCHGANGDDGFAPSLIGDSCELLYDKGTNTDPHGGGAYDITEKDAADIAAWLDSLQ